jgi:hypothetical protein
MATFAAPPVAEIGLPRSPKPALLWAIALGGVVAAACAVVLALTSDHISEPGTHAALQAWALLGYVIAGVIAWWRRPESRFGLLMIAAGTVWFLTSLSSANVALPYTVGVAFDLLPPVLFLHVYLAFPTGRLHGWHERALIAIGYATAFGAQLVGMALGGFGPDNLLQIASQAEAAHWLLRAQLVVLSALCVGGIVILTLRRRGAGRPLRRSTAFLFDSFVLGLAMIAVLFTSGAMGLVSGQILFEALRRAMFFVLGLAPLAFLAGLLGAR